MGGTIVYGDVGAEPLLGVTALESGGFEVDPRNEELKRLPAGSVEMTWRSRRRTHSNLSCHISA